MRNAIVGSFCYIVPDMCLIYSKKATSGAAGTKPSGNGSDG